MLDKDEVLTTLGEFSSSLNKGLSSDSINTTYNNMPITQLNLNSILRILLIKDKKEEYKIVVSDDNSKVRVYKINNTITRKRLTKKRKAKILASLIYRIIR